MCKSPVCAFALAHERADEDAHAHMFARVSVQVQVWVDGVFLSAQWTVSVRGGQMCACADEGVQRT